MKGSVRRDGPINGADGRQDGASGVRAREVGQGDCAENCFTFPDLALFGEPWPVTRAPGRPRHVPTDALRAKVAKLHADGAGQPEIARKLRLSLPTLRLYYSTELQSTSQAWRRREQRDRAKGN